MLAGLVLLTPWGALAGLFALLPLAAILGGRVRTGRVRRALGLGPEPRRGLVVDLVALALTAVLLAVAAAQPAFVARTGEAVRTDAQAMVVVDTSDSMLASAGPGSPTRFDRAQAIAVRLRSGLTGVETGLGTLTDRVLPNLLPVGGVTSFDTAVERALRPGTPPPRQGDTVVTSLGGIADVPAGGYFSPEAKHRVLIVLTDGETKPYDVGGVATALRSGVPTQLVLVRVGNASERVWNGTRPDPAYRGDPTAGAQLASLATAAGGKVFSEGRADAAARYALTSLGSGPSAVRGTVPSPHTLAPWLALLAIVPLAALVVRRVPLSARRRTPRLPSRGGHRLVTEAISGGKREETGP